MTYDPNNLSDYEEVWANISLAEDTMREDLFDAKDLMISASNDLFDLKEWELRNRLEELIHRMNIVKVYEIKSNKWSTASEYPKLVKAFNQLKEDMLQLGEDVIAKEIEVKEQ